MSADELKLDEQIDIVSTFFYLCQSSISPDVLKDTYCRQIFPGNILYGFLCTGMKL